MILCSGRMDELLLPLYVFFKRYPNNIPSNPTNTTNINDTPPRFLLPSRLISSCNQKIPSGVRRIPRHKS
ncbi:unnamed protein product [Linum trigynum]|uniref:Uncharacterized protein n=1 Tax=Linum trigynum TaxID=586398 RepID=A0AAV2FVC5_9ROSI